MKRYRPFATFHRLREDGSIDPGLDFTRVGHQVYGRLPFGKTLSQLEAIAADLANERGFAAYCIWVGGDYETAKAAIPLTRI